MDETHTCLRDQILPHHRQADAESLGNILKSMFVVDRIYRPKEIISDMADRYRIDISYTQAWRAKTYVINALQGSPEESFGILREYCHNLELKNPGTMVRIDVDLENRFKFFFMCMGCSIRGFQQFCRPVICIDASHLKGKYLGSFFIAVAKDGNNQIYPLAFGIGHKEGLDTWTPFLTYLRMCIGDLPDLTIISDRHHSIIAAVANVMPHARHGFCNFHIKGNMRSQFKNTKHIEGIFWRAAKAYRLTDFQAAMNRIARVNPAAAIYLTDIGYDRWARAHFGGWRYNIMTTNIAESFNALTRTARALPITILVEFLRSTLQHWFFNRRNMAGERSHPLTPWAEDKLARHVFKFVNMIVKPINMQQYEVHDSRQQVFIRKIHQIVSSDIDTYNIMAGRQAFAINYQEGAYRFHDAYQFRVHMSLRTKMDTLTVIRNKLTFSQRAIFRTTCFGHLLDLVEPRFSAVFIQAMLLRMINRGNPDREMWFRINGVEFRFSPVEFALVTGLIFGEDMDMSSYVDCTDTPRLREQYFPNIHRLLSHGEIEEAFDNEVWGDNDDDAVKFAVLCI
ncbi:uncharacterized protein LOC123221453 [Mangifera indica]|uniref:uncharacterized protein LOC123221453 n=1 Tax=Mangifera indica TaxID=29780 RepID=UPI001CFAD425|nr:uncharacterized protein LOC123221453 [Mangifera indica]